METVQTTTIDVADPTMADLRSMVANIDAEAPTTEAPEKPAEPVKEAADEKPETESGTVETKQEPEEVEPELPEGVKKRIAKEAEKQARIQSEIDRAVSARKAKEEELRREQTGSQPDQTSDKPSDGRPVRPKPDAFNTWGEYLAADEKYAVEYEAWLTTETRKLVTQELTVAQQKAKDESDWSEGLKVHQELPQMRDVVVEYTDEPMQQAISALDGWAGVTVHFGKHPEELQAWAAQFRANPVKAVAELGKLEERLKPAPKQTTRAAVDTKPNPTRIGGGANASTPKVDLETASFSDFKKHVKAALKSE